MMTEPSEKYNKALRLTQEFHRGGGKTFSGQFTWKGRHRIKKIIDELDIKSILDYGAGKGKQYINIDPDTNQTLEQYWGIVTTKYDPAVRQFAREPEGKFDLVICVQVLGSIPRDDLPWVVNRLYGFANKAVFVSERTVTAGPRKQIYASMKEDMPYNLTEDQWIEILRPNLTDPRMFIAFKTESGWRETQLAHTFPRVGSSK